MSKIEWFVTSVSRILKTKSCTTVIFILGGSRQADCFDVGNTLLNIIINKSADTELIFVF